MSALTERWLFVFRDHAVPENIEKTIALLPRAKAAGFNTILLGDNHLLTLDRMPDSYRQGLARL
ncbi:MAG: hypothetical protein IMF16_05805, partial [Proteobacteria bacterium]|nr:hypothetical protein [Pseudomonadota bacterium]